MDGRGGLGRFGLPEHNTGALVLHGRQRDLTGEHGKRAYEPWFLTRTAQRCNEDYCELTYALFLGEDGSVSTRVLSGRLGSFCEDSAAVCEQQSARGRKRK